MRAAQGASGLGRLLEGWQDGGGSAYRALAAALRTLVLDGRVPVDARLPAERELSAALAVSRTTIAAAYEVLRAEGFLISRRGAGSWTALPPGRPMPAAGLSPFPSDRGVIDLGVAAMDAPEPWLSRAMAAALDQLPSYTRTHGSFPAGLQVLREAVAARYEQRGLATAPEQVLITNGASSALNLLLRELAGPGERIAVESPSYANSLQAIRRAHARPIPVPLAEDGWPLAAWAATLRAAAPRLAYLIPDFQNPTGLVMPPEQRRELAALARATGTTLIVDETTAELALEPGRPVPRPFPAYDRGGSVVCIGSAGKAFWGGLRIGWIRASAAMVRRLMADRGSMDVSSPVLEQLAVRHLLTEELPEVLQYQRGRIREQRDALAAGLRREFPHWSFRVPDGGLAFWIRTGPLSGPALAAAAEQEGVWLASGPRFGVDGVLDHFIRLPFCQRIPVAEEALRRVAVAARQATTAPTDRETLAVV
jgi:DNA-binding transcriptional MocR family regulator